MNLLQGSGQAVLDKTKECLDRGQSQVASSYGVGAMVLEIVEKIENQRSIDLFELHGGRSGLELVASELKEQAKAVGIGVSSVRAGTPLLG